MKHPFTETNIFIKITNYSWPAQEQKKNILFTRIIVAKLFPFFYYYSDFNIARGFNYPVQDIFVKL